MAKTIPQDPKDRRPRDRFGNAEPSPAAHLLDLIKAWEKIRGELQTARKELDDLQDMDAPSNMIGATESEIRRLEKARKDQAQGIAGYVEEHPNLRKAAIQNGFPSRLLSGGTQADDPDRQPSEGDRFGGGGDKGGRDRSDERGEGGPLDAVDADGRPTTPTGGGPSTGGGRGPATRGGSRGGRTGGRERIDHLPGREGVDFHYVKGPGGQVWVVFDMDVPGPKRGSIAFSVPAKLHDRYGIDPAKVKQLTRAQIKKLNGFGSINEIKLRRGEHPFQSWMQDMRNKFGMAPSMLRDKEVMQTLFAAHLNQWDTAELLGSLQQTKWYDTKTKQRIDWMFKMGSADKEQSINANLNQIERYVQRSFGAIDYTTYGVNERVMKGWARKVASGALGWDITEVQSRIDAIAGGIRGTPTWAEEEQANEAAMSEAQEWEDFFVSFRDKADTFLGPRGNVSTQTLTEYAKNRAEGRATDADFEQYLRSQKKALFPYIDEATPWKQFADPYLSALQRVMGDNASIDYDHELLTDLGAKDNNGKLIRDQPLSLYEFNLLARDPDRNPAAYQRGTALYDKGADRLVKVLQQLKGVS